MFCEEVVIDARLVVEAFEETSRHQLDEIVIAFEIFAKQDQMVAAARAGLDFALIAIRKGAHRSGFFAAVVAAALGDVHFAADDGLYIALAGFIKEIGGSEQVAVVGDGHCRHLLARSFIEQLAGFAGTIEKTEVRVDMQVNKLRLAHGI